MVVVKEKSLHGVYTLSEAETLTGVSARKLKRWLFGYKYAAESKAESAPSFSPPLWQSQYNHGEFNEYVVGFHDLLEARVVGEFVKVGLPLIVVRACLETAKHIFGTDYPLTAHRFLTDGKTIYSDAIKRNVGDLSLLNLRSRNYAFDSIIRPSLYAGIEYSGSVAKRWFPDAKQKSVVLDPTVAFGKPHVRDVGIPTAAVYATYLAERKNTVQTAKILELSKKDVAAAVRFEERLAA